MLFENHTSDTVPGLAAIVLVAQLTGTLSDLYTQLLNILGFTGTLAWVGVIASWILFRRKYVQRGYSLNGLKARVSSGQMWIPPFAMIAQIICLIMMAFDTSQLGGFFISCAAIFVPMIVRKTMEKRPGALRDVNALEDGELTFDELYPPQGSHGASGERE